MNAVVPQRTRTTSSVLFSSTLLVATTLAIAAPPAAAQVVLPTSARVVEWNCPVTPAVQPENPPDPFPGALVTDNGNVWWVTRGLPQLFRLTPPADKTTQNATCNWWDLDETTPTTGGLRLRPFGNHVYIRTADSLQRIDTTNNQRTRWADGLFSFSDVAVHANGSVAVYTTGTALLGVGSLAERANNVVQRFLPNQTRTCPAGTPDGTVCGTAVRYEVGGGAGDIYLSGIDTHPTNSNLVYYSEPVSNNIGELRIVNGTASVRRWNLTQASTNFAEEVTQPRQIEVSTGGLVYGVTGSGHLFQLNPTTNEILIAPIPNLGVPVSSPLNNPFGVDANGFVGFTTAGEVLGYNKVGTWFPDGVPMPIVAVPGSVVVETVAVPGVTEVTPQFTATTPPVVKLASAFETETLAGPIWEVAVDTGVPQDNTVCTPDTIDAGSGLPSDPCSPSTSPLGIASDPAGGPGDYFAAIGQTINRVAHVSIPVQNAGMVSGGGWIEGTTTTTNLLTGITSTTSTSKGTFGLVAMRKRDGEPVKGHVTYIDHLDDDKVISMELTDLTISGNKAVIGGVCKQDVSNCLRFEVDVTDNGQPRNTMRDTFEIMRDSLLLGVSSGVDGGPLVGGNLKVGGGATTSNGN